MTKYYTIRMFLDQCMDGSISLPAVVTNNLIEEKLKAVQKLLGQYFKYKGVLRHPLDVSKPSSSSQLLD